MKTTISYRCSVGLRTIFYIISTRTYKFLQKFNPKKVKDNYLIDLPSIQDETRILIVAIYYTITNEFI